MQWLNDAKQVRKIFADYGLSPSKSERWLADALHDRGAVADRDANPSTDLFRIPEAVRLHLLKETWVPDKTAVDWWPTFRIDADFVSDRSSARRYRKTFALEISAPLLQVELEKSLGSQRSSSESSQTGARLNDGTALASARKYIEEKKANGEHPSKRDFEETMRKNGVQGHRDRLRQAYNTAATEHQIQVRRGYPSKTTG